MITLNRRPSLGRKWKLLALLAALWTADWANWWRYRPGRRVRLHYSVRNAPDCRTGVVVSRHLLAGSGVLVKHDDGTGPFGWTWSEIELIEEGL